MEHNGTNAVQRCFGYASSPTVLVRLSRAYSSFNGLQTASCFLWVVKNGLFR